MKGEAGSIQD